MAGLPGGQIPGQGMQTPGAESWGTPGDYNNMPAREFGPLFIAWYLLMTGFQTTEQEIRPTWAWAI